MIYHQFVIVENFKTKSVMVSNTFKQHGAYITVILLTKCVPKWVTISLTLFGLQYDV